MQRRVCDQCGTEFGARSSRARFCTPACRVRSHRGAPKTGAATPAPLRVQAADLRESVAAALAAVGRNGTPEAMMCLLLAEQAMDADARTLPGLTRELSLRLTDALKGASGVAKDPVDQLRERRERRGVA